MKTVKTVSALAAQVKADDHRSVYLFAEAGGVAVAYESFDADVLVEVKPTPAMLAEVKQLLDAAGNSVFTNAEEWRDQLNEWHGMGGGDGEAW